MPISVQRIAVLAGVTAAHAALLLIKVSSSPATKEASASGTLFFIPLEKTPTPEHRSSKVDTKATTTETRVVSESRYSNEITIHPEPSHSEEQWFEDAKAAVGSVIASQNKENAYRQFELKPKPKTEPPLYEEVGKGIFDHGPPHEVGVVKNLGEGLFTTTTTPYCYVISSLTFAGRKDKTVCREPGENVDKKNIFVDQKPDYLKRPLPEPK